MRNRALVAVAALLALLASACGIFQAQKSALTIVTEAPQAAQDQGSAHMAMTLEFMFTFGETSVTQTGSGEGAMDFENNRGHMALTFAPPEGLPPGTPGPPAIESRTIFESDTVYQLISGCQGGPLQGDKWGRVDASTFTAGVQAGGSSGDPEAFLDMLRGANEEDLEVLGTEEVRGVETTRYSVTVTVEAAVEAVPEENRDEVRRAFDVMGRNEILVDVWVDEDGLPRRWQTIFESPNISITLTFELFDYGAEVTVQIPQEGEFVDFATQEEYVQALAACSGAQNPFG